ncbi:MAG: hypothetical protein ACYC1W_00035 [Gemmatimonadaceae bacterium]|jgi:hypothetical protein
MATDDIWLPFGLKSVPFFQDPLTARTDTGHPLSLMVGRVHDLELARKTLVSLGESGRLVVEGPPGVGKTTFVNRLKDVLTRDYGFITHDEPISVTAAMDVLGFQYECLRTLLQVRTALLGAASQPVDDAAISEGEQFWRELRELLHGATRHGWGGQVMGTGVNYQPLPAARVLAPPTLHRELTEAVARFRRESKRKVLFHINNLENLSLKEHLNATVLFAQLRDQLMMPGAHWLFVGPTNITNDVFRKHAQLGGIIPAPVTLAALTAGQVSEILEKRYAYLRLPSATVVPPVHPADASRLYKSYVGDLRNFLMLLFNASNRLLGVAGVVPMTADDIRGALGPEYYRQLRGRLTDVMGAHLERLLRDGADTGACVVTRFRAVDVERTLRLGGPAATNAIEAWLDAECITHGPREGRSQWYEVAGATRVAFGMREDASATTTTRPRRSPSKGPSPNEGA